MKILHSIIIFMASAFCVSAQEAGSLVDFHFRKDTNPFLSYSNAAALSALGAGGFSVAEISAEKGDGAYMPLDGSDDDLNACVNTESFRRISDRMVFHGLLSYSYFNGKNMGGPVLIGLSYNPVNFYESTDDTRGTKRRELYHMEGALSYSLGDRWSAGMDFDYESGDQAKIKDPRFSNIWMDMRISPSVWFKASDNLSAGMSLRYRNTLENVIGGIFGTTDRQYFVFTDKGNFAGLVEQLEGDYNYMPSNSYRPMSNSFYGLSLQLLKSGDVRFENELTFLYRTGYYGKKSSQTATFFEFDGLDFGYDASLILSSEDNIHKFSLSAGGKTMSVDENLFKYVTPPGQTTVVEYYAKNSLSTGLSASASLAYDAWRGVSSRLPDMKYGASVAADYIDRNMTVYPFSRSHDRLTLDARSYFERNFSMNNFCFSAGGEITFRTGTGTMFSDSMSASSTVKLVYRDDLLGKQFEYDTASAVGAGLNFRFTRFLRQGSSVYLRLSDSFMSLLSGPVYLESRSRNVASLAFGCSF